jgi:hypothetical protein
MKKTLLAAVALTFVIVICVLGYAAHLAGQLNSPEFKKQVQDEVSKQMGAEVRVEEMDIALRSGVTLRGLAVANPEPLDGDLFTAEVFALRYELMPLLSGRVEVRELSLRKPVIRLAMSADGSYNFEGLGGTKSEEPATASSSEKSVSSPLEIVLSEVSVSDAAIFMVDDTDATLMTVEDADFESALRVTGNATLGTGRATIGTVSLADMMFLRAVSAPLEMSKEFVKLSPIQAKVAGGRATGDFTVHLQEGLRYEVALKVDGVQVERLLEEAQSAARVSGTLQASMSFVGTAGLPTMKGEGEGRVDDCKVEDAKVLALISTALQVPELASPDFDECRAEFTLNGTRLDTPVVSLKGSWLELTGKGRVNLESSRLDHQMNLAVASSLLEKIPVKEARAAFTERDDGFSALDFRVFGPMDDPQTDIASRIGRAAATEAIKDGVNKLLKRKLF